MQKIKKLYIKYKEQVLYMLFGGITTLVNWGIYYPMMALNDQSSLMNDDLWMQIVNVVAWFVSVLFAYVTNKFFVFRSYDKRASFVALEAVKFYGGRLMSLIFENAFLFITVTLVKLPDGIMKIAAGVAVVIINYVLSKLFVFKKKKGDKNEAEDASGGGERR